MRPQDFRDVHASAYRDFFSSNPLVASGNFSFPWVPGWYANKSRMIRIASKTPFRVYVGIRETKNGGVALLDTVSYDAVSGGFVKRPFVEAAEETAKIESIIQEFLESHGHAKGIEISSLSEIPRGHSFGFAGTSAAVIAYALFRFVGEITGGTPETDDGFFASALCREVFLLAWKIQLVARYGNSTGHTILNAFSGTGPTYSFTEAFGTDIDIENLEGREIRFVRYLDKYAETAVSKEIPLDYGMVFSGIKTDTRTVEAFKKTDASKLGVFSDFLRDDLLAGIAKPERYHFAKFLPEDALYSQFTGNLDALNVQTAYHIKTLLETGYDAGAAEDFIEHVNRCRYATALVENQNGFADDFLYFFRKNQSNPDETVGLMPIYSAKIWGGYLFALQPGISRETLRRAMGELGKHYPNATVDYASFRDGEGSGRVVVEQDIRNGIFSAFVGKDQYRYDGNHGDSYLAKHAEIIEKETEGILLDTIENRIYFDGKKTDSSGLKSQNATIQILERLLARPGKEISNDELPASAYAKNKNEMTGKIILPIVKLAECDGRYRLPITCSGTVSRYFIKLDETPLRIWIIREIS